MIAKALQSITCFLVNSKYVVWSNLNETGCDKKLKLTATVWKIDLAIKQQDETKVCNNFIKACESSLIKE